MEKKVFALCCTFLMTVMTWGVMPEHANALILNPHTSVNCVAKGRAYAQELRFRETRANLEVYYGDGLVRRDRINSHNEYIRIVPVYVRPGEKFTVINRGPDQIEFYCQ